MICVTPHNDELREKKDVSVEEACFDPNAPFFIRQELPIAGEGEYILHVLFLTETFFPSPSG
jgi:hypothetical protein